MFFKAIRMKILVASFAVCFLLLASEKNERFDVRNLGEVGAFSDRGSGDFNKAFLVFLKNHPNEPVLYTHACDDVKSWRTDAKKPNLLHLEFNNGSKEMVNMEVHVDRFYRQYPYYDPRAKSK